MPNDSLEARNITVEFGEVKALYEVTMVFAKGQVTGVMGPNGAGKTTLLNAITGVVSSKGQVLLGEHPMDDMQPWERQALGVTRTFQRCELIPEISVSENILVGAHRRLRVSDELFGGRVSKQFDESVKELARLLGIGSDLLDQPVGTLPYGWQRRVEIARALIGEPSFLLLDEPVAGMDPEESAEIGSYIREWVRSTGHGAVMIEHDVDLVAEICDLVYVLDFGQLIASGSPQDVLKNPQVVEAYLGSEAVA